MLLPVLQVELKGKAQDGASMGLDTLPHGKTEENL